MTAEDVGTSDADMAVIAERTRTSPGSRRSAAARAIRARGRRSASRPRSGSPRSAVWGTPELAHRSVAVIGLGHVGGALARALAAAGARLVVADIAPGRRALAEELGAEWSEPGAALRADVDIVAPCALGGVLDDESVPALRCRAVAGAANNQLASDALAAVLHARGILWVPDFVANAGGIINIAVELEPAGYDAGRAHQRVRAVGDTVRAVLDLADAERTTPLAAAQALARARLAGTDAL